MENNNNIHPSAGASRSMSLGGAIGGGQVVSRLIPVRHEDDSRKPAGSTSQENETMREAQRLNISLESAWAVASNLADRLDPVMRGQEIKANGGDDEPRGDIHTRLAGEFAARADSAYALAQFLQTLINRLEI